jgi:SAM-dependent methyltransferase
MKYTDKVILRQFRHHNRESLLPILFEKHTCCSGDWFRQRWYKMLLENMSNQALFTLIHDKDLWNGKESVSGPGSTLDATRNIRAALPGLLERFSIRSVLDIPCGDFNWMQHVDLNGVDYTGADLVETLIEVNKQKFASDKRRFLVLDLTNSALPEADLILCRDVLVHLNERDIFRAFRNIKQSGAKYLLMTNFPDQTANQELGQDYWRPINFQLPPFNLPAPLSGINEGEKDEDFQDKSMCLWKIQDL